MTHRPTDEQQAVIDFIAQNPSLSLMVSARAGAAKTSTIVMASEKITQSCLAVAFNKRNADDLKEKLPSHITCKTLNGLGHAAWGSKLGKRLTLDTDKMYRLTQAIVPKGTEDFADVLALARKAKSVGLVPHGTKWARPTIWEDTLHSWQELGWQVGVTSVDSTIAAQAAQVLSTSIAEAWQGTIDFDDQIYMSVMFAGNFSKFHTVIVDESQDLSYMNHLMLKASIGTRLIAIGDPYQAIYAFRGADANSMENMAQTCGVEFNQLKLTSSFRVPHSVAARQTEWVQDFTSHAICKEGMVAQWPDDNTGSVHNVRSWNLSDIPDKGFIICRNNAPLMNLAFALIKSRRPVKILGRDIGSALANLLEKIAGKGKTASYTPVEDILPKITAWAAKETAKVSNSETKQAVIREKQECLEVLIEASDCKTVGEAAQFIRDLFSDRGGDLVLMSGHKSKGLEHEWVMHLDPFRLPSKFALAAEANGNPGPLIQENNLKYVIETRTMHTLVLANLEDCEELS